MKARGLKKAFKQGFKENPLQQSLFSLEPAPEIKRCGSCNKTLTEKRHGLQSSAKRKGQRLLSALRESDYAAQEEAAEM